MDTLMDNNENINSNGWNEYKLLVLRQLEGLTTKTDNIEDKIDRKIQLILEKIETLSTKITVLETKSLMYGALGGFIATAVIAIIVALVNRGH